MKNIRKSYLAFVIAWILVVCVCGQKFVQAATHSRTNETQYVVVDVERFTIDEGYFIEPTLVEYHTGDTAASVTQRLFDSLNVETQIYGSIEDGTYYLAAIENADTHNYSIPSYISANGGPTTADSYGNDDDALGEFDYSFMSGWMITVNHLMIPVGAASYDVQPGDVIRWQFTVWGYGADLGVVALGEDGIPWGDAPYYTEADKSELLYDLAYINCNHPELKGTTQYRLGINAAMSRTTNTALVTRVDSILDKMVYSN